MSKYNESELLGEWSDTLSAWWLGANNCEWIAYKGSHQIFVYPCEKYPEPPFQVVQYSKRIETLEDFTDAMYNGEVFEPTYSTVKAHWQK